MTPNQLPAALRERYATEIAWLVTHGFDKFASFHATEISAAHDDIEVWFPRPPDRRWYAATPQAQARGVTPQGALVELAERLRAVASRAGDNADAIDALLKESAP